MTDELKDWQKDFALKEDLRHGDFEAIELALFEMPNAARIFRNADLSVVRGAWLKAAIQAGWIVTPECKALTDKKSRETAYLYDGGDVDRMHPARVLWLGAQVIERHDSIMSEDPKN